MDKATFRKHIENFKFTELFNDLGWNFIKENNTIKLGTDRFEFTSVAEKEGFRILVCGLNGDNDIPDHGMRLKLEGSLARLFKEHLLIFCDRERTQQIWQTYLRLPNRPATLSVAKWHKGQDPEFLYQKASGLIFTLDEEDNITIVDVTERVSENFDVNRERITKRFYDMFKAEHSSFISFIKGISSQQHKDWYASLMLNRLMFCYFIQKRGFLDNNRHYLRDKLAICQKKNGTGNFYSFYRNFLLILFHEGLNEPRPNEQVRVEIGRIPYLNGGLFDEHELEKDYKIDIDDRAFERLFDFFDEYEWHLDTRVSASGKDINPDVIGYIFEKYINDRAEMGAYYTKEDITDYISRNCILPWLLKQTADSYPAYFANGGPFWSFLHKSVDGYLFEPFKYGIRENLPNAIEIGLNDISKRVDWNKMAAPGVGLTGETWREAMARTARAKEVATKIETSQFREIEELTTWNINIRQFVQDIIEGTDDPLFLKAFYQALKRVTVIDPTCGSGAFLFAAMNILEPLYFACILRMQSFVEEQHPSNGEASEIIEKTFAFFKNELNSIQVSRHPNIDYYIYKSIILNNLFGVDIMNEAVEIAKLRLFLKLVSTVEPEYNKPNLGLEPLPDIDFNIRSGNSLIGFSTRADLAKGLTYTLDGVVSAPIIEAKCQDVSLSFSRYKTLQLTHDDEDFAQFKQAKADLITRLKELNAELNKLLHKQASGLKFDHWLKTHKPFHWLAEFFEIIQVQSGFDVVIGNPPYVEYKDVKDTYSISGYETFPCGDLYAFCIERSVNLLKKNGAIGLIVPISIFGTDGFATAQRFIRQQLCTFWISTYSNRPSQLFDGAQKRLTIILGIKGQSKALKVYTSSYYRWRKDEFDHLFSARLSYISPDSPFAIFPESLEKIGSELELTAFKKIVATKQILATALRRASAHKVYYTRKFGYFLSFLNFVPEVIQIKGRKKVFPSELKELGFASEDSALSAIAALSSSTFFWFWNVVSDCRNLNKRDLLAFPFDPDTLAKPTKKRLATLAKKYLLTLSSSSRTMIKSGLELQTFAYAETKPILDQIDMALANHFGFSEEEVDFIVNYDIKYRIGTLDNDDE